MLRCVRSAAYMSLSAGVALAFVAKPLAGQNSQRPRVNLEPCRITGVGREVSCSHLTVSENPANHSGRQIMLNIVVLPARTPASEPAMPLFYLAGGPGGAATQAAPAFDLLYPHMADNFDIVLVDQRGSGGSNPLKCDFADFTELANAVISVNVAPQKLSECRDRLDADLRFYTTPIAMDDLDRVRAALGYDVINILASSYGTRAALVYLRRHEAHVRSLVLHGVAPMKLKLPGQVATDAQAALDTVFASCTAQESCARAYPNLDRQLQEVLARLAALPAVVSVTDPVSQEPIDFQITRDIFAGGLRMLLYATPFASRIPLSIASAFKGEFEPFMSSTTLLVNAMGQTLHFGLYLSVVCTEDVPFLDVPDSFAEARKTFHGEALLSGHIAACKDWPRGELPPSYSEPVRSDVPTLLISGDADPVTGPRWGEEAASHLSNSLHIIVPNAGHADAIGPCEDQLISAFVRAGSLEGLDPSCVSQRPPRQFALPTGNTSGE
jgi:pimeloyl-ACP methyl ester carboxylesterase